METITITPTCGMCRTYYTPDYRKNGVAYKTCKRCRDLTKSRRTCEHGRERSQCRDCGGGSICQHDRRRSDCKDCGGGSICPHDRHRSACRDCGGSQICQHDRQRSKCKECKDAVHITILTMVSSSRSNDKKDNRYDDANFITYEHVVELIESSGNLCHYCKVECQFMEFTGNLATIERIDNTIGHIIGNCVVACKTCNVSKVGNHI